MLILYKQENMGMLHVERSSCAENLEFERHQASSHM